MKRLVQVWMVAVTLLVGAQAAQAAPIALFSWEEDYVFWSTTFRLTHLSGPAIEDIAVVVSFFDTNVADASADMSPTTITADPDPNDFDYPDQSLSQTSFDPGSIESVLLSFYYYDEFQVRQAFSRRFSESILDKDDENAPTYAQGGRNIEPRQAIPEPLSLSLLGLGLAATAIARRRRQ